MLILPAAALILQGAMPVPTQTDDRGRTVATVSAIRVDRAPTVDGRLDDAAWKSAMVVTGLVQSDPDEGRAVSESTEVRIVYDGAALYVGARMFDRDTNGIVRRLGRRDVTTPSDEFQLLLDTYHDRRTTFLFAVSSSGVQRDAVAGDDGDNFDESWDAVWQSASTLDSLGWTVEMRIPFSQLRFSKAQSQVWGVRFVRWIQRKNERALYPFVAKTESGVASRFAELVGLRDLGNVRGVEILPYTVARQRFDQAKPGNPFDDGHTVFGGAGLDVKAGLSPSFKLDFTANPDFGQVELDPSYVNLTQFEQFLTEHRPFFTEGSSLFSFGSTGGGINPRFDTPLLFYSRRIGRPPQGEPTSSGDFTDMPEATTILGAAKLSGKTANGWSVGTVEALTAREFATVADATGPRQSDEVEPLTNYFATRVKRDFSSGNTTLGFVGTGVQRSIDQPALKFLGSGAYAGGVDFLHRWGDRAYSLAASVSGSLVHGDTMAINEFQEASDRYYQRPDARHYRYDSTATSLSGVAADVYLNKVGGNWVWSLAGNTMTPGFEVNDLGFQERVDIASLFAAGGYKWTQPGKVFRQAYAYFSTKSSWNYDGDLINRSYNGYIFGRFRNFWEADFSLTVKNQVLDDRLTRGGPLAMKPAGWTAAAEAYTDNRKAVSLYAYGSYTRNSAGGWYFSASPSVTARPIKSLSMSLGLGYEAGWDAAQYVETVSDSTAIWTMGRRYVFAALRQRSAYATLKVNAAFSRTLSLQLYAQPFTFIGAYDRFSELFAPRTYIFNTYGVNNRSTIVNNGDDTYTVDPDGPGAARSFTIYNPNFRERSFRSNAVLRWEYRPGSTIFFVWSQTRYGYFTDVNAGLMGDLRQVTFRDRPTHVLQVKVNYWLRP